MKTLPYELWEPVIGLEIHVQLNTRSKLFSLAPNQFGAAPNTQISAFCTGQPGSLPLLNQEAIHKAILFGLAIHAEVQLLSTFDRKSYFYPDSPRNFQITQHEHPLIRGGAVLVQMEGKMRSFQIDRAHLEDDVGMLKHFSTFAGVDYNRAGAPLLEVVSKPCMRNPKEAIAYAMALRSLMLYLGISNVQMEEGQFRIDANISVRPRGESELRPRVEVKNLNSFSFLEKACEAEVSRQIALYMNNPQTPFLDLIPPGTYRWDQTRQQVVLMRPKESAEDYRYFPEPDLPPILLTRELLDSLQSELPELPHERFRRYVADLGLTEKATEMLVYEKALSDYFEMALKHCNHPRLLCNWITVEFAGRLKARGSTLIKSGIPPAHVGKLVQLIDRKQITGPMAKALASEMVAKPESDPEQLVLQNSDYQMLEDLDILEPLINEVLEENPKVVADFKAGKSRAFAHLVGTVMRRTDGKASPHFISDLLRKKIL